MAKKGTKIDTLYLSLGLDVSELDADMVTANQTLAQGVSDLRRKMSQVKLKTEIEMTGFEGAEKNTEALAAKLKGLNEQLAIQKNLVKLASANHMDTSNKLGGNHVETQKALTNLLREQKAYADIEKQISAANKALGSLKIDHVTSKTGNVNALAGAFDKVKTATNAAGSNITSLNNKMIALAAMAATGGGLFSLVKGAVEAGDATYKLSTRLNITASEAGNLNRMFKITDTDSQAFISTIIRIDRSISNAGKSGNDLTRALDVFGVKLTDSKSSLLPMTEQLKQLAIGYQNAAKAGEEDAYVSEVLGAKGAALVPILREYAEAAQAAGSVHSMGINPEQAHEAAVQLKILEMQASQFKMALADALMPVVDDLSPSILAFLQNSVDFIKANKNELKNVIEDVSSLGTAVGELFNAILKPGFEYVLNHKDQIIDGLEDLTDHIRVITEHPVYSLAEIFNPIPNEYFIKPFLDGYKAERAQKEQAAADRRKAIEEEKKQADAQRKAQEEQSKQEMAAKRKSLESAKEIARAKEELAAEEFKATHTQFESELFDIEVKRRKMVESTGDEATAAEIANLRKASAIKKHNAEVAKLNQEIADEIYSITHSETEKAIQDIERQKKAWIDKGAAEVAATEAAESKKAKVLRDAALQAIQSKKEELAIIADMQEKIKGAKDAKLIGADGTDQSEKFRNDIIKNAYKDAYDKLMNMRKKSLGLDNLGFDVTPELIMQFEQMQKQIENNLLPGFSHLNNLPRELPYNLHLAQNALTASSGQLSQAESESMAQNFFSPWHEEMQKLTSSLSSSITVTQQVEQPRSINIGSISVTLPVAEINNQVDTLEVADTVANTIMLKIKSATSGGDDAYKI